MTDSRPTVIQQGFFLLLLTAVSLAFLWVLWSFLSPIFWAAILAISFNPVNHWMRSKTGGRANLASLLTLVVILITVVVPALFIASAVIGEALVMYERVQSGELDPAAPLRWLDSFLPQAQEWRERVGLELEDLRERISSMVIAGSQFIASMAFTAGQRAVNFTVMFVIMVYLLFFFLRDGEKIVNAAIAVIPLEEQQEQELIQRFTLVARASLKGTGVIGLVQGVLGGIIFALLGIQGAVLWGVVMAILSMVPAVGAALVWIPAAISLLAGGMWVKALILVLFGSVVIGMADNVLRPILVGRDTQLPDYLILLSSLGGILVFGIAGFIVGPVIAALFLACWGLFAEGYHPEAEQTIDQQDP